MRISDRLSFAIRLAELPLDTLTDDGWSRLRDDLWRFLMSTVGNVTTGSDPPDYSREDVRALKAVFREILEQVARGWSQFGPKVEVRPGLMRVFGRTRPKVDPRFMFTVSGSVRACAPAVLMYLLAHEPVDRIRRCTACPRLFIKRKGQKFCSEASCEKARTALYWKRYLTTPKGKSARRRALKRQYEQHGWAVGARTGRLPKRTASDSTGGGTSRLGISPSPSASRSMAKPSREGHRMAKRAPLHLPLDFKEALSDLLPVKPPREKAKTHKKAERKRVLKKRTKKKGKAKP